MNSPQFHHGSCHCGAVRFQVELDLSKPVVDIQKLQVHPFDGKSR